MLRLKEVPPGAICYSAENIGDDRNAMEVRETFYVRDPDRTCRYPHNVAIGLIGMAQGDPAASGARYVRMSGRVSRDPGEADGRTLVKILGTQASTWSHLLPKSA